MTRSERARGKARTFTQAGLTLLLVALCTGCSLGASVVMIDSKTALEQQAASEFKALENDLEQAGIQPKAEAITRGQLEEKQVDMGKSTLGEIAQLYSSVLTESEWIDQMLSAHCIGEAKDGVLKHTPEQCKDKVDKAEVNRAVERANLHRRQLWQVVAKNQAGASDDKIRATWRTHHLKRVVCGGLIQQDDGKWEEKKCE